MTVTLQTGISWALLKSIPISPYGASACVNSARRSVSVSPGKKIHTSGIVPGGMTFPLTAENRKALLDWIPEVLETAQIGIDIIKKFHEENGGDGQFFARSPTHYLGTVGPDGAHEIYDGKLRLWIKMVRDIAGSG